MERLQSVAVELRAMLSDLNAFGDGSLAEATFSSYISRVKEHLTTSDCYYCYDSLDRR